MFIVKKKHHLVPITTAAEKIKEEILGASGRERWANEPIVENWYVNRSRGRRTLAKRLGGGGVYYISVNLFVL